MASIKAPTVVSDKQSTKLILINELFYLMGRKGARSVEFTDTRANRDLMALIYFEPKDPTAEGAASDQIVYSRWTDSCLTTFATDFKVESRPTRRGDSQKRMMKLWQTKTMREF